MTERAYQLNANSGDRFGFGFFVAVAFHALIILGIGFEWEQPDEIAQVMDVTLVTHFSESEPDEADFFAQANQEASGTLDEALIPTSPDVNAESDTDGNLGAMAQDSVESNEGVLSESVVITTTAVAEDSIESDEDEVVSEQNESAAADSRRALLARLDLLRQDYAKRPKIGTLTSVAAKAREDAEYQVHLQERVIEVGNQNYPQESVAQAVFGSLRIMLTILPDGTLESTEITESSGHQILDSAAIKIARLAAPFMPFSSELRQKYDKVVFIRTWQFLPGGTITSVE